MVVFSCGALQSRANPRPSKPSQQREDVLKVKTEVVNVVAVVRDRKEKLIADLGRTDFEILEDGVPQEVRYFSRETDISLTLGLLMDTSGSVQNVLDFEKEQAKAFFRRVMRPKDMAFVISFDIDVLLLKDFTGEVEELARAIDSAVINTGGALSASWAHAGREAERWLSVSRTVSWTFSSTYAWADSLGSTQGDPSL